MKRNGFALFCAAVMSASLIGAMPVSATDPENPESMLYEDLNYDFQEDGSIIITNCLQNAVTCEIPESIDGRTVTAIADSAFSECYFLEEVVIPDSVTSIGRQAFSACSVLKKVTMPETVTSFGAGVFDACSALEEVTLPGGIEELPQAAFYECTALTKVTLPEGLTTIGSEAFYNCAALTELTLPESTDAIADYAFQGCEALTELKLPAATVNLGQYVFQDCGSLEAITVDEGNAMFCDKDGVLFTADGVTLVRYPENKAGESYTVPDGCTQIANGSFVDAVKLKSIDLNQATVFGRDVFFRCTGLESLVIPEGTEILSDSMLAYCSGLKSVTLPSSLTMISDYAFYTCAGLTELVIPEGTTSIGAYAFFNCMGMKKLYLPDSIEELGDGAMGYYAESEDTEPQKVSGFSVEYGSNQVIYDFVKQYDLSGTGHGEFPWLTVLLSAGGVLVLAGGIALIVILRKRAYTPRPVPGGRQGSASKRPDPNKKGKS
ncbi:MAG: leucine-rich repeat domain-containing protein [Ruminococcus sp.]|nr:leucine-rich repeat domain-containing protein [Ruminococcus sp.]